jgi:UDPglucose 6-dehydrogenase
MTMNISVIGMGKLGAPLAAVLASSGNKVIGLDKNPAIVDLVLAGIAPVTEAGLQELMDSSRVNLSCTLSYEKAVAESDISFVIVPTPSTQEGIFTNKYILDAVASIGREIARKKTYHIVNICSTVMPGSCEGEIRAALEKYSGKRVGDEIGLCYNPEFIALGSVVKNMQYPDMILVGCNDEHSGAILSQIYRGCCKNEPPIRLMSLVNAEITKITVNTYITTKISFVNMVSELCDRLPGADIDVVSGAVGLDSRIGSKYFKGGLGYGGPCFPRDNVAFTALCKSVGVDALISKATDEINERQVGRILSKIRALNPIVKRVGILGLTYKSDTPVTECSQSIAVANQLLRDDIDVRVFDPMGMESARAQLSEKVIFASSAGEVIKDSEIIIIMTPWTEFKEINFSAFSGGHKRFVIDCWRLVSTSSTTNALEVQHIGYGP